MTHTPVNAASCPARYQSPHMPTSKAPWDSGIQCSGYRCPGTYEAMVTGDRHQHWAAEKMLAWQQGSRCQASLLLRDKVTTSLLQPAGPDESRLCAEANGSRASEPVARQSESFSQRQHSGQHRLCPGWGASTGMCWTAAASSSHSSQCCRPYQLIIERHEC